MMNASPSSCEHRQDDLVLYHYDELGATERADFEAHLHGCAACQEHLASLQALEVSVPRQPSVSIGDEQLAAIRQATSRRLADMRVRPARARILSLPSMPRMAMAACVALLVFLAGRYTAPGQTGMGDDFALPSADARISDIEFDPESGFVQISYEETRPNSIQADLNDARVQTLLGRAMQDEDNPGGRLRALRAVSQSSMVLAEPDPVLVDAMEQVLRTESNDGIRLQTVKALKSLHGKVPVPESLKEVLITMLSSERNPAIRIEVLQLLASSERASMEWKEALMQARSDTNPFIRSQAESALAEMESSGPLESVQ